MKKIIIAKINKKYASLMPRYYHPKYFYPEPLCYWRVHEILRRENVN